VWVEGGDIQDELLDQLGGVLAPPDDLALTPSAAELEALALAVAARWPDQAFVAGEAPAVAPAPGGAGDGVVHRLLRPSARTRRLGAGAWRAGTAAAGIVLFSASAAAAANGGVPLPRPVRVVAYTVGLPVDSPALDDTHQHIKDLNEAVKANDKPKAVATVRRLQTDLRKVPADEKKEATPKVVAAITEAVEKGAVPPQPAMAPAPPAPTTTTTAPAPSTTATTVEESKEREKEKDKDRPAVTTATRPTTTTTEPESTTTTTAPPTDETPGGTTGDPGTGDGQTGAGTDSDPGTTPTTVPAETTTTTTGPPPEETTTTTTTMPEPSATTTTTAPPSPAP
jgi:hypothetical protein